MRSIGVFTLHSGTARRLSLAACRISDRLSSIKRAHERKDRSAIHAAAEGDANALNFPTR